MTILEMREKRAKAWEAAKAFLDSHRTDKGVLSAEDDATYSRMEQEISDLGKEISRMERLEALDAQMKEPVNHPLTGKPMRSRIIERTGRASNEYRTSFWDMMRSKAPLPSVVNALQEGMDLFYSLKSPYRKKAVWVLNDSTIKAVRKLKDSTGQYLWQPSLMAGTPDTLLGRPLKTSTYMPVIAAGAKTIAFGDFSYYWIADRQGRSFKRLNELYAANGQVGFLGSQRMDGKLVLSEAVKVLAQKASA